MGNSKDGFHNRAESFEITCGSGLLGVAQTSQNWVIGQFYWTPFGLEGKNKEPWFPADFSLKATENDVDKASLSPGNCYLSSGNRSD